MNSSHEIFGAIGTLLRGRSRGDLSLNETKELLALQALYRAALTREEALIDVRRYTDA
jgi:hypothetical protein